MIVHNACPDDELARTLGIEYADLYTMLSESDYLPLRIEPPETLETTSSLRSQPSSFSARGSRG